MQCPFFKIDVIRHPSREVGSGQRSTLGAEASTRWCAHAQSPVTRDAAHGWGGAHLLRCGGDTSQCQLPTGAP